MAYLTKSEVAKNLRVHPRTVERWLKGGDLVGHKLGEGKTALWRIPEVELNRFLEKHKNTKQHGGRKPKHK